MADARDITNPPPGEFWLGKIRGQWPLYAFTVEAHATGWLETGYPGDRRLWKVTDAVLVEMDLTEAVPSQLQPREASDRQCVEQQRSTVQTTEGDPG
ncbi:MAG TPA: hypothetical protein VJT49_00775 [Amycolatopsis sp.]|uniref:hypothetical protein n=1 Tax=Amycolatopsis sp. TaxID=37632 RepID=UPI002B47B352|nr:hypothetical protein [Amycolatopsis sp.]HKS43649.1 hypothetical protein [Amycolatopsis sp.]